MDIKVKKDVLSNKIISLSPLEVLLYSFIAYVILFVIFGFTYYILQEIFLCRVVSLNNCLRSLNFLDYFYFSIITQTTGGYNDYVAIGIGKFFAPLQTVIAIFLLVIIAPLLSLKLLIPHNAILFAKKAILSKTYNGQGIYFEFRCINTKRMVLRNVEISCTFKQILPANPVHGTTSYDIEISPNKLPHMAWAEWYFKSQDQTLKNLIDKSEEYIINILITGSYYTGSYSEEYIYKMSDLIDGVYAKTEFNQDADKKLSSKFHEIIVESK